MEVIILGFRLISFLKKKRLPLNQVLEPLRGRFFPLNSEQLVQNLHFCLANVLFRV